MKVLLTGSSGFIGQNLTKNLIKEGYVVMGVDLQDSRYPLKNTWKSDIFYFQECNILEREKLVNIISGFSPNIVLHLAARTDLNEKKDLQGYAANITGVENLLTAIACTPSVNRAIFTSSQLVCQVGYLPKNELDYSPNTLYGESKVLTEKIVRENDGGGVEWCIVRPTTVWGPGMAPHYQRFFQMVKNGQYFHIGNQPLYKSYGYIENVIYQYIKLLKVNANQVHRKTFYLADYHPLSLRHWANLIQQELAAPPINTCPEGIAKIVAKVGDIINALGYKKLPLNSFRLNNVMTEYKFDLSETEMVCGQLPYSLEQAVKETVKWLKEYKIV